MALSTILLAIVLVTLVVVPVRRPSERRLVLTAVGAIVVVLGCGLVLAVAA